MKTWSETTKFNRYKKFLEAYSKAMCELHLMKLSGMISRFEYEEALGQLEEATLMAADIYGIRDWVKPEMAKFSFQLEVA